MRTDDLIQPEELIWMRDNIYIGQKIEVIKSDAMWEQGKHRKRAKIIAKYPSFVLCEFEKGIRECFLYIQILLGEGIWLV